MKIQKIPLSILRKVGSNASDISFFCGMMHSVLNVTQNDSICPCCSGALLAMSPRSISSRFTG